MPIRTVPGEIRTTVTATFSPMSMRSPILRDKTNIIII